MVRIAIDATGCENGFGAVLRGAEKALDQNKNLDLVLVGGEDKLPENFKLPLGVDLVRTKYTYDSNIKPNQVESSIYKSIEMNKSGDVDAVIALGDTRGAVEFGYKVLGLMPKVLSPAIPTHWPLNNVLLDSGASPECEPKNLYQFAIMGNAFSKNYLGVENPLISIITNGTEIKKGSRFAKKCKRLIDKLGENGFNIAEGFFEGTSYCDLNAGIVGVLGGEIGNMFLKSAEGAGKTLSKMFKDEFMKQNWLKKAVGYWAIKEPLEKVKQICDPKKYSAGPLLGVEGNIMICHGGSDAEAISNAIKITERYLKAGVNEVLKEDMIRYGKV